MTLSINIIGAGNVGKTFGNLFVKYQVAKIVGICNTNQVSALHAIQFIGDGQYYSSIGELPASDITFITTPDDLIPQICQELSKNPLLKPGNIIIHCSGSLTSEALLAVKTRGCYIASIHPMRSFAKPELSIQQYNGTYCAIEGDREAVSSISSLFNSIGSVTYGIDKEKKALYHAAGVIASNYLVTLSQQALLCMQEAGVEDKMAMQVITNIMRGTVSNLEKTQSPVQSLTGPIQRGDISTIKKHVEAFENGNQKELYAVLGKSTLSLTNHDDKIKEVIEKLLQTNNEKADAPLNDVVKQMVIPKK